MRAWVASLLLAIPGCWSTGAPARTETAALPGPVARHRVPIEAEFGVIDGDRGFHRTADISLHAGSVFGWRIHLPCRGVALVRFREELRVPSAGDWWGGDPAMTISADQRTATVRSATACVDGWIGKSWTVSPGDPAGPWVLRVTVEGFAAQTFRATFAPPRP